MASLTWPDQRRFPVNHARIHVRNTVDPDLVRSERPLVVAGYSSLGSLIELVSAWGHLPHAQGGVLRLLFGFEPFPSTRSSFSSAQDEFTEEVRRYWLEQHSVSVRLSAKVVRALEALDSGTLQVRMLPGRPNLHAKIYVGDEAATVGSSNYTDYGMSQQFEGNARFEKAGEPQRFAELSTIAENYWSRGLDWSTEFRLLLMDLLKLVPWQEALGRACAELLEGDWIADLGSALSPRSELWPSQRVGIAEALWVVENLGSVLIADATGSGKTRMGAHLVAAVRNRLWDTGRARRDRDLMTLVCPPSGQHTWQSEALASGVTIMPVSQGMLSRRQSDAVTRAQVLAVDEAHNFLTAESNRTRRLQDTLADHVLLFTATPISRGAQDLLSPVGLLGADNFEDETLAVLERLERGMPLGEVLTDQNRDRLREEIQRFTVRRTKAALNALVDQDEDAYRDSKSGRVCRYPAHDARLYPTQEPASDEEIADQIRELAGQLRGLQQLGRTIRPPDFAHREMTDDQVLVGRLHASRGLARHNVLAAMRSSRAALLEHLAGTESALDECGLAPTAKTQPSGNMIARIRELSETGRPTVELSCELPLWLTDDGQWSEACEEDAQLYEQIRRLASRLTEAREVAKAELLAGLAAEHRLVLAFDQHPITLAAIRHHLALVDVEVLIATGESRQSRKRVEALFARDSKASAIALCSDALNEGLNLQGVAALVHLDLPTTLRVAEQRVGRVDRMDSPHERISVWWPHDGKSFATRGMEILLARRQASESLLGSNLPMPVLDGEGEEVVVPIQDQIRELDAADLSWDGIGDALDPVRRLIDGDAALISRAVYAEHRTTRHRVMARVAPVASATPWAFFSLARTQHGAPRWLMIEGEAAKATAGVERVVDRLRDRLRDDPPSVDFDESCEQWLDRFLSAAARHEHLLLPRRMQRALEQMTAMTDTWMRAAMNRGDHDDADRWRRLCAVARPARDDEQQLDPYLVGEAWWDLVRPLLSQIPRTRRQRRYVRLRDLDSTLRTKPLDLIEVQQALSRIPRIEPVDRRISAAIIGVPPS